MNATLATAPVLAALLLFPQPARTPNAGGHVTTGDPRNEAVMPVQRIEIDFDHRRHVEVARLACADCHGDAARSRRTRDYLVPARDLCLECHDQVEIPWRWGPDHLDPANAVAIPPAHLHFSHAQHLKLDGVDCATCHLGVETAGLATRDHLPPMETCLSCHDGHQAPSDCTACHLAGRGGRIRTNLPSGVLKPDDHGPHFLRQHGVAAARDAGTCAACHAQEDCLSCHAGAVPPSFHDNHYLAIHAQEAMANRMRCASCHVVDRFCADCHLRAGVRPRRPLEPRFEGNFHPPGWSDFPPDRPDHHAHVARKNLSQCTACHVQEDCLGCHAWFPGAARTHGPGWAGSDRMRRLRREAYSTCLTCHLPANPSDPINLP